MIRWTRSVEMKMFKSVEAKEFAVELGKYMEKKYPVKVSTFLPYQVASAHGNRLYWFLDFEDKESYEGFFSAISQDTVFQNMRRDRELDLFIDGTYDDVVLREAN